ncbi:FAD-binding protein [Enemella sp. A6]|uniref:FAD-binding oxidoreductase n=1 Tax=Enemella sp. A6 TaxID=3440152 RepID=UPI003EBA4269
MNNPTSNATTTNPATGPRRLHGWGRTNPSPAVVHTPSSVDDVLAHVTAGTPRGIIARGLGRSYGDPAQNAGGLVLDLTRLNRILHIDAEAEPPTVTVEAGVSLDQLMKELLHHRLWVPVLPGTRQVTIGGAIGADVHGKNHHTQGSFGNHVRSLDLVTADGKVRTVGPENDPDLFWATIGGMGLTGVVVRATVEVQRVETAFFAVDTDRTHDLDDLMARMTDGDDNYTYSVAWFDAVTRGKHLGRAVLTRGNKASVDELPPALRRDPLKFVAPSFGTIPDLFPNGLLNRVTARAFSEFWFRKAPKHAVGEIQNITQFFHPLDILADWNRVYGPAGFLQYQFAVPFNADAVFRRAVETIVHSGHVSALNVLKRFGPANPGMLSFPMPGWTLTVDFPIREGLADLCRRLDELVLSAGGRTYLAKDSRVSPDALRRMYPRLADFTAVRDRVDPNRVFVSDQSRRLDL